MRGEKHGFRKNGRRIFLSGGPDRGDRIEIAGENWGFGQQIFVSHSLESLVDIPGQVVAHCRDIRVGYATDSFFYLARLAIRLEHEDRLRAVMTASATRQKIARLAAGGHPRVLDLFSGCDGLSLGFHAAGIAAAIECDPDAAKPDGPY
jgi:hypothetical protein